ncbi:aminotransferase class V-fold PLP-dependent enzyme [bacterium]|nr:aminotransferase class V-fold PLP-dependent enzyme [bacterium]
MSLEKNIALMLRSKNDKNCIFSTGPAEIELHPEALEGIISYLNGGMMNPRSQEFGEILIKARENINRLVGLTETHEVMFATGSGSNAAQAMCSCVRKKDKVALLRTGIYAERLRETLEYARVPVFTHDSSNGRYPNLEEFEKVIKENKCNVIAMIAGPTGDAVIMPVEKNAAIAKKLNVEIILDTISTFGAEPHLYMRKYGEQLRAITVGLNKALRCGVFGLNGAIVCKRNVIDDMVANRDRYIWVGGSEDLASICQYNRKGRHKQTISPMAVYLVEKVCKNLLQNDPNLVCQIQEMRFRQAYVRKGCMNLGMRLSRHEHPAPLMAIGSKYHLPEKYSTLGEMQLALSKVTINGWHFDIYGESESQELRIFSMGFPGVESREMEKKAIKKEITAAIERNDQYARAWFSGESADMFPLEEQVKVQIPAIEHEIGTYSDFLRAIAQIL